MSDGRIATRYARPLLELAGEKGVLDEVARDMGTFATLCAESREFSLMLKSPIIPHFKKAKILRSIFADKVHSLTMQAFDLITRKNRENTLEAIANEFVRLCRIHKGLVDVRVTTPFGLDDPMRTKVKTLAQKISGKEPILTENVDAEILGGFILKIGDRQIDDSVRGRLNALKLKFSTK